MQPTGFQPTGFQPGPISVASGDITVAGITITITPVVIAGSVTTTSTGVTKPPGGDDAFHPGVQPRLVKTRDRKAPVLTVEDLEETYNRILGIEPQTKAEKRVVKAAQKAVQRHVEVETTDLPPASAVDWVSLQADLKAVLALREAYERLLDEEDEEALVALLLAA